MEELFKAIKLLDAAPGHNDPKVVKDVETCTNVFKEMVVNHNEVSVEYKLNEPFSFSAYVSVESDGKIVIRCGKLISTMVKKFGPFNVTPYTNGSIQATLTFNNIKVVD